MREELNLEFDIVICVGPHDVDIIHNNIQYSKKNIIGYRNIYLICSDPSIVVDETITIDEKIFPFSLTDISNIYGNNDCNGWYLQQLLKLYAGNIIPNILKRYLVIDCDTCFLKPTQFITNDSDHIFTTGTEYNWPYFIHMNNLHPSLKKIHPLSGISHHTFFNTDICNELFKLVENYHNTGQSFWQLFLNKIDPEVYLKSGASEYEIYFTYMYVYHLDKMEIRQLNWDNASSITDENSNCDFVSMHWPIRSKNLKFI